MAITRRGFLGFTLSGLAASVLPRRVPPPPPVAELPAAVEASLVAVRPVLTPVIGVCSFAMPTAVCFDATAPAAPGVVEPIDAKTLAYLKACEDDEDDRS